MIEIEVKLLNGIHERLNSISDILAVDFDKVLNVSLLIGFRRYWEPIVQAVSDYPEWQLSKDDKDTKIQMVWDMLAQKIEADFQNMEEVEVVEKDFDELYPDDIFKNPIEKQKEFIKFLDSLDRRGNDEN